MCPSFVVVLCAQAADGSAMRSGHEDESVKDTIEKDECRLAELGKRTVEMYVISHIFAEHLEVWLMACAGFMPHRFTVADLLQCQNPMEQLGVHALF